MDKEHEQRLARVIERLRTAHHGSESERERDRRLARERVLAELPHLSGRIDDTVAEINDTLNEAGATLRLVKTNHTPVAQAIYSVSIAGAPNFEPVLVLVVDGEGRARAMLERDHHRSLMETLSVYDLDKAKLADFALSLLESHE
jgi:hypothetical protein